MAFLPKIPKELKLLLKSLPGVAVKSISYPDLIRSMTKTGGRYLKGTQSTELEKEVRSICPKEIELVETLNGSPVSDQQGELVLSLYFAQLKSTKGIFLDLGAKNFSVGSSLQWKPTPLWHDFKPAFLEALRNLYKGYYLEDEDLFMQSLSALGLTAGCSPAEEKEIRDLFYVHFGENTESVEFSFNKFFESFSNIFEFLNRKSIQVPVDFVYLGLYLTTLYKHLSEYDRPFNVKAAFLATFA